MLRPSGTRGWRVRPLTLSQAVCFLFGILACPRLCHESSRRYWLMQLCSVSCWNFFYLHYSSCIRLSSHAIILVTSHIQVPLLHPMCNREHSEVSLLGLSPGSVIYQQWDLWYVTWLLQISISSGVEITINSTSMIKLFHYGVNENQRTYGFKAPHRMHGIEVPNDRCISCNICLLKCLGNHSRLLSSMRARIFVHFVKHFFSHNE